MSRVAPVPPSPAAILDTLDVAVLAVDRDWVVTYANDVWAHRRGRPALVGTPLLEAFPRLAGAPELALLQATLADGRPRSYRVAYADEFVDGTWDVTLTREPGGQLIITSRDVTAQAHLEEVHDHLLDSIGEGLFVCNADWRMEYWNAAAERITRRPRATVVGRVLWSAFPGLVGTSFERLYRQTMTERTPGAAHAIEYRPPRTRRPDTHAPAGTYDARSYPVAGGGILVIFAEVSARERQAQLLRTLFEEARAANDAKTAFLATLSHELRTPLAALTGYGELLEDEVAGPLVPAQKEMVGRLRAVAHHLTVLIEEMLTFAALESRSPGAPMDVRDDPVDVGELLQQLAALVEPLARAKGLAVSVELAAGLPPLCSDQAKLQQILLNLVSNAIKFTETGAVRVRARPLPDGLAFDVIDTGVGIAEADRPRLFRAFGQLDEPIRRRQGGTGLGLYLSRRLAELLGGGVEFSSTPGVGSTFTVTLPARRPAASGAGGRAAVRGS